MDDRTVDEIRAVVADELGDLPPFVDVAALRGPAADAILRVAQPDAVLVLHQRLRAEAQATVDTWIADGAHSAASIQAEGPPSSRRSHFRILGALRSGGTGRGHRVLSERNLSPSPTSVA
jgi:hypothetical protein